MFLSFEKGLQVAAMAWTSNALHQVLGSGFRCFRGAAWPRTVELRAWYVGSCQNYGPFFGSLIQYGTYYLGYPKG